MADTRKARLAAVASNAVLENQVAAIYVHGDSVSVESHSAVTGNEQFA
jgi:hypothetical protein